MTVTEPPPIDPSPRRCVLCVPASEPHKVAKALASGADEVVVDLEDAVAPERKGVAREVVRSLVVESDHPRVTVRVNPLEGPWGEDDLEAVVASSAPVASVVLPKVESAQDLRRVDATLDRLAAGRDARNAPTLQALVETARGVTGLAEVVRASDRLEGLVIGYADLAASLGRRPSADPADWVVVQQQVLLAARSAGLRAVDGPHLSLADDDDFRRAVARVAAAGFDAKWVVHPRQAAAVVAAFSPSADEVAHARRVVDVLGEAHATGGGAVSLDGRLVDEAMAVAARRVLARVGSA